MPATPEDKITAAILLAAITISPKIGLASLPRVKDNPTVVDLVAVWRQLLKVVSSI